MPAVEAQPQQSASTAAGPQEPPTPPLADDNADEDDDNDNDDDEAAEIATVAVSLEGERAIRREVHFADLVERQRTSGNSLARVHIHSVSRLLKGRTHGTSAELEEVGIKLGTIRPASREYTQGLEEIKYGKIHIWQYGSIYAYI